MIKRLPPATWLMGAVSVSCLAAILGRRLYPSFDVRGPFVAAIPVFVALLIWLLMAAGRKADQTTRPAWGVDAEFVKQTALQYGFEDVTAIDVEISLATQEFDVPPIRKLVLLLPDESMRGLPDNWRDLPLEAQRFAIVRALALRRNAWVFDALMLSPIVLWLAVGLVAAGIRLWLIPAFYGSFALLIAFYTTSLPFRDCLRDDAKALEMTGDLAAALSYVEADLSNVRRGREVEARIKALHKADGRLGIR
ncbi:MAG TPA: hypothetical protein VG944_05895 [Fimbriimonas sp.]|nr:hypothetical protein [Fimbriimonas sp.]